MKNKKTLVVILIIVLLVITVIISFLLFIKKDKDNDSFNSIVKDNTVYIEGTFTNEIVNDYASAKDALNDLKEIDIDINDLKEDSMYTNSSYLNIYNFYQVYNGIKVYDSYINVYTDKKGNVHGCISNLKKINIDTNINSSEEDLKEIIKNELSKKDINDYEIKSNELIIYPYKEEYVLAHKYDIKNGINTLTMIIRDSNREIIEMSSYNSNHNLTQGDINEFLQSDGSYKLYDSKRNISMGMIDVPSHTDERYFTWKDLEDAKEKKINIPIEYLNTVQYVYDYYLSNHQMKGFGILDGELEIYYGDISKYNESTKKYEDSTNAYFASKNGIVFGKNIAADIEVTGHEYTHGIFYNNVKNVGYASNDNWEGPAIYEAYSDVMGMIIESKYENKKNIDGVINTINRNIKNSKITYNTFSEKGYSSTYDEHYYSTIISKVAYEMNKFLTLDELDNLWYDSMFLLEPTGVKFEDCEYAVLRLAKARFSDDVYKKIKELFDNTEIKEHYEIKKYDEQKWDELGIEKAPEEKKEKSPIMDERISDLPKKDNQNKKEDSSSNDKSIDKQKKEETQVENKPVDEQKSITLEEAKNILIRNVGNTWKDIPVSYEYISKIKLNDKYYYAFIEYSNENFMKFGGECLEEISTGKYYVSTYFVEVNPKNKEKIACNYAKNYNNTVILKNDSIYDGFVNTNWCEY